jgi:hypothetical protein
MSTTTVAEKLKIRAGATLWLSDAAHTDRLSPLPEGVRGADSPDDADVVIIFASDAQALRLRLREHAGHLTTDRSALWIAYPKGRRSDLNRDSVWPAAAEHGLRPIGQIAIDGTWSALRFRPLAEGEQPFTGGGTGRGRR